MTPTATLLASGCIGLAALAGRLAMLLRDARRRVAALSGPSPPLARDPAPAEPAARAPGEPQAGSGRDRTAFLAVLSHEIRTPLNGIIGLASVLLELPLGPTERNYVRIILESGNHLLRLINDILDYTRLNAGRLELVETAFDVRAVIRGAVELLETEAAAKQLALLLDIGDDVPRRAGGDPARLRQILLNLVGNALKFTRKGSVSVTVTRGAREPHGVRLHFTVTDTGIGIAPEAIGKLFAEFSQVDASISRRFGGSGLGLVICKQLVERMGGTISVESAFGHGSTFRFDILVRARRASDEADFVRAEALAGATEDNAANDLSAVAAATDTRSFHVLVAEDNATNRLVATRMLERIGHRVDAVPDGREAVAAVQRGTYDLVLMDVMMPEMDGLQATTLIRALPGPVSDIPIVGLTATDSRGDETACRAAGMNHFATKPITAARLAEAIDTVTAGRRPVAELAAGHVRRAGGPGSPVENRTFDPAVLDDLVGEVGADLAAEIVRGFIDNAGGELAKLRDLVGQGANADVAQLAHELTNTACSVGLLRLGRAAAEIRVGVATAEQLDALATLLWTGIEELRMWRP